MSDERIDLTQFEKITHEILSFNVIINGEETTEYQRSDLWNTWILNEQQAAEGKALLVFTMDMQNPVCLIEGYETAEEGLANAKAIAHVPKMIAELKRMYEKEDMIIRALKGVWIGTTCWHQPSEHLEDVAETRGSILGAIASLLDVDVNRQNIHDLEGGCGGEYCDYDSE